MVRRVLFSSLALLVFGQLAQAGPIVGSASLAGTNTTADTGNIKNANTVTFQTIFVTSTSGDFAPTAFHNIPGPFVLNLASPGGFTFGDAAFGTFTTSFVVINDNTAPDSRSYSLVGLFVPGTLMPTVTANSAALTIALTQANSSSGINVSPSIGAAITLVTPNNLAVVPEPSTVVLAGMGVVGLLVARRRSRVVA